MPRNTPNDRFDSLPHSVDRVGAHRGPAKKGRGWIVLAWAFGATVLLVGVGSAALYLQNDKLNFSMPGAASSEKPPASASATPSASPEPTETAAAEPPAEPPAPPAPAPTVDPNLSVTVLNGTPGTGVAAAVGETLTDAGWTVDETGDADSEDVAVTTVYYADASLEGAALGAAASIPGAQIQLSDAFSSGSDSLTVVVGNDYVG